MLFIRLSPALYALLLSVSISIILKNCHCIFRIRKDTLFLGKKELRGVKELEELFFLLFVVLKTGNSLISIKRIDNFHSILYY